MLLFGPSIEYVDYCEPFPCYSRSLAAPFLSEFSASEVFYRYTDNETLLDDVASCIDDAFDSEFYPTVLFVATWNRLLAFDNPYSLGVVSKKNYIIDSCEINMTCKIENRFQC